MSEVRQKASLAKEASRILAQLPTATKNQALLAMADALEQGSAAIIAANAIDVAKAREANTPESRVDRLLLNEGRIRAMAASVREIVQLADPIGEILHGWRVPNGLEITQVRVPLGVIGIIYESRPNVTVDCAALCLKSGNAVLLRGGSEAINSNQAIIGVLTTASQAAGIPKGAIGMIETTDRWAVREMLVMNEYLDLIIPRGGAGLIEMVVREATVPTLETGVGNCHIYVHRDADLAMAKQIMINAKCSRPGVCNAAETLLVDRAIANDLLPSLLTELSAAGVEIRGDEAVRIFFPATKPATGEDWATEFLDLILAVKVVADADEALAHIAKYSTKHSEAIVTQDLNAAQRFLNEVDAAAVYLNASTRFTDGGEFGFGAEMGISTQKLHARGPVGLKQLTSTKYLIRGNGQIR